MDTIEIIAKINGKDVPLSKISDETFQSLKSAERKTVTYCRGQRIYICGYGEHILSHVGEGKQMSLVDIKNGERKGLVSPVSVEDIFRVTHKEMCEIIGQDNLNCMVQNEKT